MSLKHQISKAAASFSAFGITHFTSMSASNFPGQLALKIDSRAIEAEIKSKVRGKKIVVVGTNGKTSVNNMIADCLEAQGLKVLCNRSGANMKAGVCTTVLRGKKSDVGVFESDELWTKETLPAVNADYLLLLNLFRDQLDRCGEIDRIQSSIVEALRRSPKTTLIYNADDPLCTIVAEKAAALDERKNSNKNITFGVDETLHWEQNSVSDTTMCQKCQAMLEYDIRQYDKLGKYHCPECGFCRPELDFSAVNVSMKAEGLSLDVANRDQETTRFSSGLLGSYNVYNMLACVTAARIMGASDDAIAEAIAAFNPENGRLQRYEIDGVGVLLNLAKNPTGFNQNLRIISSAIDPNQKTAVAFFINDQTPDGHDISWIWDIDFEELAKFSGVTFFSGGDRKNDLQVRLKHAGIRANLCDSVKDAIECGVEQLFVIANYTALPVEKRTLDALAREDKLNKASEIVYDKQPEVYPVPAESQEIATVKIAHVLPELLNLYGDGGNVKILKNRCAWRGIPVEVIPVYAGEEVDFSQFDIIIMGGSPDREQELASGQALRWKEQIQNHVESGKPMLVICGSYQMLGNEWLLNGESVAGLSVLDIKTDRPGTSADRLVQNIAIESKLATRPVIGFENHAGRTHLNGDLEAFGQVVSTVGCGNNEQDHADGVLYKSTIGTYLHGPLLSKNPEIADWLIAQAIAKRDGVEVVEVNLAPLDDAEEIAANVHMAKLLIK